MEPILLITHDFPPKKGGVARFLGALAEFFGEDMRVISTESELLARFIWPRWIKSVLLLVRTKDQYRSVLVSHILPFGTAAWVASWLTGKPYSVLLHGMDFALAQRSIIKRWLTRCILSHAKNLLVNSMYLADDVRARHDLTNITVVYPPVAERPQHQLPLELPLRLLTVSRLVKRKGHLRVLEALALLRDHHELPPDLEYHVVGNGPMASAIKQAAFEYGLSDRLVLHWTVEDKRLRELYESSHVFVMPTIMDAVDREGFGMVYLEAAAHGMPSIATDMPGVDEAVLHEKTGLLVADGDIAALAKAIRCLIKDVSWRQKLGTQARSRACSTFTPETQFCELKNLL